MKVAFKFLLLFFYFSMAFFLLGIVVRVITGFFYIGEFYLSHEGIVNNFYKSAIAGAAITLAAIAYNLIDKFKARKSPPSDPD